MLRRAQLTLILAILVPTILMLGSGIILVAVESTAVSLIIGVLVLALCTTAVTGYILGSMFVLRGAALARVQNDYLSSVSHELRTPLTSIKMFIETLRHDERLDPAEKQKCIDLLAQEMERVEGLVMRLLDLSRIETGNMAFQQEPTPVKVIVEDALRSFDAATIGEPTTVECDLEEGLMVHGDRGALAMAVTNLLTNAWKYTDPAERSIRIETRRSGDRHVEITVRDNGHGIPINEQKHIFEQFERGKNAIDSRVRGSGLGLAIVRAVVREHRGKVDLTSEPGAGSTFRIRLRRPAESK